MSASATWRLMTPAGAVGAIAVIELAGDVDAAMRELKLPAVRVGAFVLADLLGIDRGVVARWSGDVVHLMPHGGAAVLRTLLERLAVAGLSQAVEARWPEAASEIESRMLATLARAASSRAVDLLLAQPARWQAADAKTLAAGAPSELMRLLEPPVVAAVGRANIGKSTLCNALAGRAVSLVADEPGTTRDHVGVLMGLDGVTVRYVDCPGFAEAESDIEAQSRKLAVGVASQAALVLNCGDPKHEPLAVEELGFTPASELRVRLRDDLPGLRWSADIVVSRADRDGLQDAHEVAMRIRRALVSDVALGWVGPWRFW